VLRKRRGEARRLRNHAREAFGDGGYRSGGSWSGRVEGSEAFVAIVKGDDQIVAYACENGKLGSWFFGPADRGNEFDLVGAAASVSEWRSQTRRPPAR
jgi:hypothetical protein